MPGRCLALACLAILLGAMFAPAAGRAAPTNTLTVGLLGEPGSLNPLTVTSTEARDIVERIYLKLLDEQGDFIHFQPRLARSWSASDDGLAITFELRDDVHWDDGVPVTAEDVRFTWELEMDTTVAWPSRSIKERIRDVEVTGDHTVVFHFTERYPYQLMDANDGVVLPKHLLDGVPRRELRDHAIGRAPVGDGPYRLSRWESGQYIELVANEGYYEGAPEVDRVIFKFVPDMVSLVTQLKKGEIDLLESVPADQLAGLREGYPRLKVYRYPSRRLDYVSWNTHRPPFDDAAVRRALTMAIDRKEIVATVWGGNATLCDGPIPPVFWAHDPTIPPIPYDPEGAAAALAADGWVDTDGDGVREKGGKSLVFELNTNNGNAQRVDVCTLVEAYLRRVGAKANIRTLEFGTFINRVLDGNYDACVLEFKVNTKLDLTEQWHTSAFPRGGYNISFYANAEVDSLIETARVCLDTEKAGEMWSRVQHIIARDQPFTFIASPDEVNVLDTRFCNVQPNAISFYANLRHWQVGTGCE